LLFTPLLGILLPFVRLKSLANVIPREYVIPLPEVILGTTERIPADDPASSLWTYFSWQEWVFILGALLSLLWFALKLLTLLRLKLKATVETSPLYTKIVVKNSNVAFSFFGNIFLGDAILLRDHDTIIRHELVHIRQKHSWDLLYFEILRIVFWFNPLIYGYQKRISEVHEFIADSEVAKDHKKEQYQLLLSTIFNTSNLSFINPFFKKSLLKKRIMMLQKSKSGKTRQLKYLVLVPVLLSMLIYASCERENPTENLNDMNIENGVVTYKVKDVNALSKEELDNLSVLFEKLLKEKAFTNGSSIKLTDDQQISYIDVNKRTSSLNEKGEAVATVPYATIEEVPVFPGCESSEDRRSCFQQKIMQHIRDNFKYPTEAQELGIQGRVAIMFTINENGEVVNIKKRGPHKILEDEATRIVNLLPKMQPGKHKGKVVSVPFSIPITFKLP
ncbi:MAG: M56 family metallopeptidase, partial [Bacteroidota bacterium]